MAAVRGCPGVDTRQQQRPLWALTARAAPPDPSRAPRPCQFERFCRPYYTAGFNAYELVEASMVSKRAETVGALRGAAGAAARRPGATRPPVSTSAPTSAEAEADGAAQRRPARRRRAPDTLSLALSLWCSFPVSALRPPADNLSGADIVDQTLRDAAASGINTIRMWAHTTTSLYPFQVRPRGARARRGGRGPRGRRGSGWRTRRGGRDAQGRACTVSAVRARAGMQSAHVECAGLQS
jgi:hypothetical protein